MTLGAAADTEPTSKPDPVKAPDSTAPEGMIAVRDVYMCKCGHPASEVVVDLNTHSFDYPFACHVDNCNCKAFTHDGPFYRRAETTATPATPTGRFAQGG